MFLSDLFVSEIFTMNVPLLFNTADQFLKQFRSYVAVRFYDWSKKAINLYGSVKLLNNYLEDNILDIKTFDQDE